MLTLDKPTCACGAKLTGKQKVRCARCAIMDSPASSQCPYCLDWYYTHSGTQGSKSLIDLHAGRKCRA